MYCTMDKYRANIVGCCNLQRQKSCEVSSFTGQGAISQKLNNACNKMLCLALEYIKNCQSRVSFVGFSYLDGQILIQKFTKFDRP